MEARHTGSSDDMVVPEDDIAPISRRRSFPRATRPKPLLVLSSLPTMREQRRSRLTSSSTSNLSAESPLPTCFAGGFSLTPLTPSRIPLSTILPFLYLGTEQDVKTIEETRVTDMKLLGVISLQEPSLQSTLQNTRPDVFRRVKFLHIPVLDAVSTNLSDWFERAIEFIEENRLNDGSTIVHCQAGISRSATICLAYLMKTRGLNMDEAFDFLKARRSCVGPNFGFLGQLKLFEMQMQQGDPFE